jgi:hypothetical protein
MGQEKPAGNGGRESGPVSMREKMPKVAAFIDALRDAFGRDEVDGWIRQGMADGSFRAQENGHVIGQRGGN